MVEEGTRYFDQEVVARRGNSVQAFEGGRWLENTGAVAGGGCIADALESLVV